MVITIMLFIIMVDGIMEEQGYESIQTIHRLFAKTEIDKFGLLTVPAESPIF